MCPEVCFVCGLLIHLIQDWTRDWSKRLCSDVDESPMTFLEHFSAFLAKSFRARANAWLLNRTYRKPRYLELQDMLAVPSK